MQAWESWFHQAGGELHPVALAALAHHKLVAIHPFIDGNGRTARLVMNLILIRSGYPPTVILRVNRGQYYRALLHADNGRLAPLVNFVGRAVERSLTLYLEACTPRATPTPADETWISLAQAAEGTPYSQEYLSLLARKGRLEAIKRGRIWLTTRRAVAEYRASIAD
jgi:Fic family protein